MKHLLLLCLIPFAVFAATTAEDVAPAIAGVSKVGSAVKAEGVVLPLHEVKLSSPIEGILRGVGAKEGENVEAGQMLAIFYGNLDRIQAEKYSKIAEKSASDWKANERLEKEKIISKDRARSVHLQFEVAKLEAAAALAGIEEKTLRAPWAGQVVRSSAELGENVTRAKVLFHLVDYSKVIVQLLLEAKYLDRIVMGAPVDVRIALASGEEAFSGIVEYVDPVVDAASGLFRVKVLVENSDGRIKPGVTASVVFR